MTVCARVTDRQTEWGEEQEEEEEEGRERSVEVRRKGGGDHLRREWKKMMKMAIQVFIEERGGERKDRKNGASGGMKSLINEERQSAGQRNQDDLLS